MSRRNSELGDAIAETKELARDIERRIETMEMMLMVREPNTAVAADAYEGLRKQIVNAVQQRQAHVTQLVQFAAAIEAGADIATLTTMVDGWLESASVVATHDATGPDAGALFVVVEDLGGDIEVLAPAYVDTATSRVIRQGRIRKAAPNKSSAPSTPAPKSEPPASDADSAEEKAEENDD